MVAPESSRTDKVPRGCRPNEPLGQGPEVPQSKHSGTAVDENGGAPGQAARLPVGHLMEVRSASPKGE